MRRLFAVVAIPAFAFGIGCNVEDIQGVSATINVVSDSSGSDSNGGNGNANGHDNGNDHGNGQDNADG